MTLITREYMQQQTEFHNLRTDYGTSAVRHVESVRNFADQLKTHDILDYGCGKAYLQKGLPFPIQNYDPCMPEYNRRPDPAKIVVCTDVLEHIEPNCLASVLDDLTHLTKELLFLTVSCQPASKFLQDGRNAHLIVETPNWWLTWLLPRFSLQSFQASKGEFVALFRPHANTDVPNA